MRGARAAVLALLLLALGSLVASAGPPDEPIGDGKLGHVRLGWEGHVPQSGLYPLAVFLENQDQKAHVFRVVVGSGATQLEATVSLAAGARRRVPFVLPAESSRASVSISEDGKLVASDEHDGAYFPQPAILLVDGSASSRTIAEVVSGVSVFACAPEDLTPELATLTGFQAIVLRHANPARAGEGARGVLEDYVRAGGTVVVAPEEGRLETRALWEETASPVETTAQGFPARRSGLGRVLLAPEDPCAATAAGLALRTSLGLELNLTPRRLFPRVFASEVENEAARRTGKLLALFFVAYLSVAVVLARRLRGAAPRRVLRALVALVLGFSLLAVLMATTLRHQTSRVLVTTFVVVPEAGEAVASTEVVVASGGASRTTLVLEGEDVSATAVQRSIGSIGYDYRFGGWVGGPAWTPLSARTVRAIGRHPATFESLEVPALGDAHVNAIARARDYRPLEARVELDPVTHGLVARIKNTSGRALGPIVVYQPTRGGDLTPQARFPLGLEAGASATAPLTTRALAASPLQLVGYPQAGAPVGWDSIAPRGPDGSDPRFVLLAEDEPPVRVTASDAVVREHAWRVESVPGPTASAPLPGFVGLKVKPLGVGVRVVASNVLWAQRSYSSWLPQAGSDIISVGGVPVHSQEDLDRAFARIPDGGWVEIATPDIRIPVQLGGAKVAAATPGEHEGEGEEDGQSAQ